LTKFYNYLIVLIVKSNEHRDCQHEWALFRKFLLFLSEKKAIETENPEQFRSCHGLSWIWWAPRNFSSRETARTAHGSVLGLWSGATQGHNGVGDELSGVWLVPSYGLVLFSSPKNHFFFQNLSNLTAYA